MQERERLDRGEGEGGNLLFCIHLEGKLLSFSVDGEERRRSGGKEEGGDGGVGYSPEVWRGILVKFPDETTTSHFLEEKNVLLLYICLQTASKHTSKKRFCQDLILKNPES